MFGYVHSQTRRAIVARQQTDTGVSAAIRMMTELQTPFGGLIRIHSTPLTHALDVISR